MSDNATASPLSALKKLLPMIGFTYLLVSLPFIWMSLHQRWAREHDDKTVELCVDGPQWEALAEGGEDPSGALTQLKDAGVSSISAYWNGDDPVLAKSSQWEIYRRAGF